MERIHPLPAAWVKESTGNSGRAVHRYEDTYSLTEVVEDMAERPEAFGKRSGNAEEYEDLRLLQNPSEEGGVFLLI